MNELALVAPLSGPVVPLADTPDPVFSGGMMGDGLAIEPLSETLLAPCEGRVVTVHASRHAITIETDGGAQILLHVGIDTVALKGAGFRALVRERETVTAGHPLLTFDADAVARAARSLQTMVVVTNPDRFEVAWRASGRVEAGTSRLLLLRPRAVVSPGIAAGAPSAGPVDATIAHPGGLHARPAAMVRAAAARFDARVTVRLRDKRADAASVLRLMSLGTREGDRVQVEAHGAEGRE